MRDVLHWLPLRQRIEFRVAVLVWYSLIGQAPAYLTDLKFVVPPLALGVPVSPHLRLLQLLAPPPCRAGPSPWLALWYVMLSHALALRSLPRVFSLKFLHQIKTKSFGRAGVGSASE